MLEQGLYHVQAGPSNASQCAMLRRRHRHFELWPMDAATTGAQTRLLRGPAKAVDCSSDALLASCRNVASSSTHLSSPYMALGVRKAL